MARNIEIKARIDGIESILPLAAKIASEGPTEILQDDTFFTCLNGRLKLRAFSCAGPDFSGHEFGVKPCQEKGA